MVLKDKLVLFAYMPMLKKILLLRLRIFSVYAASFILPLGQNASECLQISRFTDCSSVSEDCVANLESAKSGITG
jgi:hypothetical protein